MSRSYWDTPLVTSIFNMDHGQLKRSRSDEALDRSYKRSKTYQTESTQLEQQQQQQAEGSTLYPTHSTVLKPISISTKTVEPNNIIPTSSQHHAPLTSYENINGLLHSIHLERFGDPERRESWWEQDTEMTDISSSNTEYSSMNSVLRQAFLHRRKSFETQFGQ